MFGFGETSVWTIAFTHLYAHMLTKFLTIGCLGSNYLLTWVRVFGSRLGIYGSRQPAWAMLTMFFFLHCIDSKLFFLCGLRCVSVFLCSFGVQVGGIWNWHYTCLFKVSLQDVTGYLDLFKVLCTFYHGIHHHFSPPVRIICLELFPNI